MKILEKRKHIVGILHYAFCGKKTFFVSYMLLTTIEATHDIKMRTKS